MDVSRLVISPWKPNAFLLNCIQTSAYGNNFRSLGRSPKPRHGYGFHWASCTVFYDLVSITYFIWLRFQNHEPTLPLLIDASKETRSSHSCITKAGHLLKAVATKRAVKGDVAFPESAIALASASVSRTKAIRHETIAAAPRSGRIHYQLFGTRKLSQRPSRQVNARGPRLSRTGERAPLRYCG